MQRRGDQEGTTRGPGSVVYAVLSALMFLALNPNPGSIPDEAGGAVPPGVVTEGTATTREAAFTSHISLTIAGGEAGTNDYEQKASGDFISHTHFKIAGIDVVSDLTGRFEKNSLAAFKLVQKAQGQTLVVERTGDQVVTSLAGKTTKRQFAYKGFVFFSNYHPALTRNFGAAWSGELGKKQNIDVYIIEASAALKLEVSSLGVRIGTRDGQPETANGYRVQLPNVAVDFYTVGDQRFVAEDVPVQKYRAMDSAVKGLFVDPLAAYPELSQPTFKVRLDTGISVPMRDGVHLIHDVAFPNGPGKFPVILERTPYGRAGAMLDASFYAKRGYIFIAQDARGREDSEGEWDPFVNEGNDGFDTIQWLAKQPWCDGNVGMIGGSYGGYVQWAAAVKQPPALKCIVPQVSPPDAFTNIPYEYGVFALAPDLWWLNIVREKKTNLAASGQALPNPKGFLALPLTAVPKAVFGQEMPMFTKWLQRDTTAGWKGFDYEHSILKANIPALNISGWFDGDGIGTRLNWEAMRAAGRTNQWLIEGPWIHAFNTTTKLGEYNYGPQAILELDSLYLRWFDTWLKHKNVKLEQWPKAKIFVTGENKWHDVRDFPEPGSVATTFFLSSGQLLTHGTPKGAGTYTYDPSKESTAALGKPGDTNNSVEVKGLKDEQGCLVFETPQFEKPATFEGGLTAKIYVKTDVVDTDLFGFFVDIQPDGRKLALSSAGKLDLAYRQSFEARKLLKPGTVYQVTLRPWNFAHQFAKGHRLGFVLCSSLFPAFARNLNTGEPILTATRMVPAHITILHDQAHPSSVTLYKVP